MWCNSDKVSMKDIPLEGLLPNLVRDLEPCDLISLVFLLYDEPGCAFEKILFFQRTTIRDTLLSDWAKVAKSRDTWKDEFLEALCVCQLFRTINDLGLDFAKVKQIYNENVARGPQRLHYIDPMKVSLYKLCENLTLDKFQKLINCLSTFNIETDNLNLCELIFLKLMCVNFITVKHAVHGKGPEYEIELLAKIVDSIAGLSDGHDLRQTALLSCVSLSSAYSIVSDDAEFESYISNLDGLEDSFMELASIEDIEVAARNLRQDCGSSDAYPIKNFNRLGICYIINEDSFYPSKNSMNNQIAYEALLNRDGSDLDVMRLKGTMHSLKITPVVSINITYHEIFKYISYIIREHVHVEDSLFMLCIMSHGVRDHVFSADSVAVNIDSIKELVGDELLNRGIDIPKVMFIQACQVDPLSPVANTSSYVGDGVLASPITPVLNDNVQIQTEPENNNSNNSEIAPIASNSTKNRVYDSGANVMLKQVPDPVLLSDGQRSVARNADFLIFNATSPKLAAFRQEIRGVPQGSIFITTLCQKFKDLANSKHLDEIFTAVNGEFKRIFMERNFDQVPIFNSSLTKPLYLKKQT